MTQSSEDHVRSEVRDWYAQRVNNLLSESADTACCGSEPAARNPITTDNYDRDETPFGEALALSFGCGNPLALAELEPGERVLDLGSGGGLDVLLSARRVGPTGMVYGLDMTPEMLAAAERHRREANVENARFLLGTIEEIPLGDESVDVVISNCVINLSPNKDAVLSESFRVLAPGGRFAVADIVCLRDIPEALQGVTALWAGCISGALRDDVYLQTLESAGFVDAEIEVTREYERHDLEQLAGHMNPEELPEGYDVDAVIDALAGTFASAFIRAVKPLDH